MYEINIIYIVISIHLIIVIVIIIASITIYVRIPKLIEQLADEIV